MAIINEETQNVIASLTNEDNTETIESLITAITNIPPEIQAPEPDENAVDWEGKYSEMEGKYSALQQKYVARFMAGKEVEEQEEPEQEESEEDSDITIDDLYK